MRAGSPRRLGEALFLRHELALLGFGTFAWLQLARCGAGTTATGLSLVGSSFAFALLTFGLGRLGGTLAPRARLTLAYVFALFLYQSVRFVVPLSGVDAADVWLRGIDVAWFGSTPAAWFSPHPVATEFFSAVYLSYQLWLHLALVHALTRPVGEAVALGERVFTAMALGFAGYLLVPALGPANAFPELAARFDGWYFTAANAWVVRNGSSVFDVFPSLHVAIPALLLAHDARHHPRRFRRLLPLFVALVGSTLYLRYHYVVDLAAGGALAFIVTRIVRVRSPDGSGVLSARGS